MKLVEKLHSLGLTLPPVAVPLAAYVPAVREGCIIYTSGQIAMANGALQHKGRLGENLSKEDGMASARICALNALAAAASIAGGLDNIERIIRLTGYVSSTPDFTEQPAVVNGASQLMLDLFGDDGRHARSAVGVSALPLGASVEVELIVKVRE